MEQFFLIAYFIVLGVLIKTFNILYISIWLIFGAGILISIPIYQNIIKSDIRNNIKHHPETPVININKAHWWEFNELPYMTRVMAKRAVWIRNHNGKYISKEDFFQKNNIKNELERAKISPLIYY